MVPTNQFTATLLAGVLLIAGCSSVAQPAPTAPLVPSRPSSVTTTTLLGVPPTRQSPSSTTSSTVLSTETLAEGESLAGLSDGSLDVFDAPNDGEPSQVLEATTILGTPRVVGVLEGPVHGWLRVRLPVRPNGSEGWVRADDVSVFLVDRRVEVDLSDRSLRVVGPEGTLLESEVAIGSSESPTPVGHFFVTDSVIVSEADGPWGPHAYGLSAYSDTITEFNGGNGIVGIHGTNQPGSIGQARSLGCVRVPNDVALALSEFISAGVPVTISY